MSKKPIEVKNKTNSQSRKYFSIKKQTVRYFIKFNKIDTKKPYKKGIEVLLKITSGNIKKKS